jgi:tRNA A-37 threonylcarbamoyl transferase component Bud32
MLSKYRRRGLSTRTAEEYQSIIAGAEVLEQDGMGAKVLRLRDGKYLKFFRDRRLISSNLWKPYYHRFISNSIKLKNLGVYGPVVTDFFKVDNSKDTIVIYEGVTGTSLEQLLNENKLDENDYRKVAQFLKSLHLKGIYFRSLHPGNIIVSPDAIGVIDVADIYFHRGALSENKIRRNFRHFTRTAPQQNFPEGSLENVYQEYCKLR